MQHQRSRELFEAAKEVIPGGVDSPVRAFASVGLDPIFYESAHGSKIVDVDGNEYIDFIGSWGPMILGQTPAVVLDAVRGALDQGTSYGAPCERETELAALICEIVPAAEQVRFVSSGTEATMTAIRLARGYTGRECFIKFEGNYHGHSDALLVSAGSGVATFNIPGTPGVTAGAVKDTLLAQYNNLMSVRKQFEAHPNEVAAVIVEPVAGNMGVVPPAPDFLEGLRELCDEFGALLIFDEVITGFRTSLAGAQGYYNITPDITTFGKIIGGGFPVGAVAGKREIMQSLAPVGPVYQAGTLSGNPIAMTAGLAMLQELKDHPEVYEKIEALGAQLEAGLNIAIEATGVPAIVNRVGSTATIFFCKGPVVDYASALKADTELFSAWFAGMTERGFIIAPSQFEALFISAAMTPEDIEAFCEAALEVLKELMQS